MAITIYCVGYTLFPGDDSQQSGCCTILIYKDKSGVRQRTLSYGLGKSDYNTAQLQAIRLGLMAIKRAFRQEVLVCITDTSIISIVESNSPENELISGLQTWIGYFDKVEFGVVDSADVYVAEALNIAGIAADSQKNTDSGSLVV